MAQKKAYVTENDRLATLVVDGVEKQYDGGAVPEGGILQETEKLPSPCAFGMSGSPDFRAALVVGTAGIAKEYSALKALKNGVYDNDGANGLVLNSESHNLTGIVIKGKDYVIKDSDFSFNSVSDGSDVCDFIGYGAVVAAYDKARVELDNVKIRTYGVAKPAVFCDSADVVMKNSEIEVHGGKLYDGYINSADVSMMVAPPWVLGITGNARGTNLVGKDSSFVVVDCDTKANQWGVLSTDVGGGMQMFVLDSSLTLMGKNLSDIDKKNPYLGKYGSGYGTYALGSDEFFHGCEINVGTYAVNISGGNATYASSMGDFEFRSKIDGSVLYRGTGKGRPTEINSDVFGFMAHGQGELTVTDGTIVNCVDAPFHLKSGGVRLTVSDAVKINSKSGVLIQLIDDDDDVVGTDPTAKYDLTFFTEFNELPGWPSENGRITSKMERPPKQEAPLGPPPGMGGDFVPLPPTPPESFVTLKNVELSGDIYNGSGYFGIDAKKLYVTLESDAHLTGAIASTELMHINENGRQNTHFTSDQYYYLGHVKHRPFYNGDNDIYLTLEPGALWIVTGESIISSLTMNGGEIVGKLYLDGVEFFPECGRTYTGALRAYPNE